MCDLARLHRFHLAPWLVSFALLVGGGCSGAGSSTNATGQIDDPEIASVVKNTKDPKKRREQIAQILLRRGDPDMATALPPKAKPVKGKTARSR